LPLALRFRWPVPVLAVIGGAFIAETLLGVTSGDPIMPLVALLLAIYAAGSRSEGWAFWLGGLIAVTALAAQITIREGVNFDITLAVGLPAAGLLVGRALGVLTLETDVLEERASRLERERDQRIHEAIADERGRIARELHDVIGHSISVMGVQAGGVRRRLGDDHAREREALLAIEGTGRQAVSEMRRLIGLLRMDVVGVDDPSPSLKRVEQLVAKMRAAGLAVELSVTGRLDRVPPGVDVAGYRIVQEALTNALKHAPQAHVSVGIRCESNEVAIDVVDDGAGVVSDGSAHVGHGLVGMRERTALYGGTLNVGPLQDGGFAVSARIPLGVT
jgi:signal transduction histidine kinase